MKGQKMPELLNAGVVGCGYWGPNLIRNFQAIPDSKVKMVCDFSRERLNYIKENYSEIETTTEFEELLKDSEINAIIIATSVNTHFTLAQKSLMAGKHTFIEKPMASSSEQCMKLIELAEKNNLILMIGHTFVYTSSVRKIKEIIASGEIGDLLYISSRRLNLGLFQKDINVAWDLAPHDISIILYVLDEPPVSVNCFGKAHLTPGIEDVINMTINFSSNKFATINSSWLDPHKVREMKFVGSKKMIVYDDIEPLEKIKIYDKRVEVPPHYDTFAEFQYAYHYGDMYAPYVKQVEPLRVECQHFMDCILNNTKSESSGHDGLQVVQILESSSESLRKNGAKVDIT